MRDMKSAEASRIKENLKNSFNAYYDLLGIEPFAKATNVEQARAAIKAAIEHPQKSAFNETPISEKYTNFELELAALYKGLKDQKTLTSLFNSYFDKVQGSKSGELFDTESREPISKEEALNEVFNTNDLKPKENERRREDEHPDGSGEGVGHTDNGDGQAGEVRPEGEGGSNNNSNGNGNSNQESTKVHLEELGRSLGVRKELHNDAGTESATSRENEGAKLEEYARKAGIWRDNVESFIKDEVGATELAIAGSNGESKVYEDENYVYKDRPLNFSSYQATIDNFLIGNELSPESAYELIAVGPVDALGMHHVVLRQKKFTIDSKSPITAKEIDNWFADRGFQKSVDEDGNNEYRKGGLLIVDGVSSNFARNEETGEIEGASAELYDRSLLRPERQQPEHKLPVLERQEDVRHGAWQRGSYEQSAACRGADA